MEATVPKPNSLRCLTLLLVLSGAIAATANAQPAPDNNSVLILGATVGFASPSLEEAKATELGYTVVIDSDAAWSARSTADFATFRAIILGDRTCAIFGTSPDLDAAIANRAVWSPAVTGNMVIVGTDPTFHSSFAYGSATQGDVVTKSGIAFAADADGKTGLYAALSCYYHDTAPLTPVPVLDQFGLFTVTGVGCYNDSHIVAVHDALAGLTDESLSNWSCSVHEAFDTFPSDFLPLAIAENVGCPSPPGTGLNFADGTCGTPYILARGEELSPIACGNGILETGEECDDGNTANGDGCSAQCTVEIPTNNDPSCSAAAASSPVLWPPNHQLVPISIVGVTDPDGDTISITVNSITQDEPVTDQGQGAGKTSPDASLSPLAVRAERNGNPKTPGDGRVYQINFTASDGAGGSCSATVTVCVPHDNRPGASCVASGASYSSIP